MVTTRILYKPVSGRALTPVPFESPNARRFPVRQPGQDSRAVQPRLGLLVNTGK
jgi:hypothetical protein